MVVGFAMCMNLSIGKCDGLFLANVTVCFLCDGLHVVRQVHFDGRGEGQGLHDARQLALCRRQK